MSDNRALKALYSLRFLVPGYKKVLKRARDLAQWCYRLPCKVRLDPWYQKNRS